MVSVLAVPRDRAWRLRLCAALLAVVGQLGIFGASLALSRQESSANAHVERSGIALHHGHNDATCAVCGTLSLQATVKAAVPISAGTIASLVLLSPLAQLLTDPQLLPNCCRAPPREV